MSEKKLYLKVPVELGDGATSQILDPDSAPDVHWMLERWVKEDAVAGETVEFEAVEMAEPR